ncbi:MAG: hypothetical protein AB8C84_02495 [Oligoflexales bacterium]
MAQWMIMNASSGQKEGPFQGRQVREHLRLGKAHLYDYIAIQGSPVFRKIMQEERIFEVRGAAFKDKEETLLSQHGDRNSFLGLASPEAVGRRSLRKQHKVKLPEKNPGRRRDRELKRARNPSGKAAEAVKGLKYRQDKKAAKRSWQKATRYIPYVVMTMIVLLGLYFAESNGLFRPRLKNSVTRTPPQLPPAVQLIKSTISLKSLGDYVGRTIQVGPLRYRSASLRECLKQQNRLAKCEIEVRDATGGRAVLSFFYQAWGKEILKRRENLYVSGLILADGKTIILTELVGM